MLIERMEKQTSFGDGSLSLRRDVVDTWFLIVLQWGSREFLLLKSNGKPKKTKNLTWGDVTPRFYGPRWG